MLASVPVRTPQDSTLRRRWHQAAAFTAAHGGALGVLLLCLYVLVSLGEASEKLLWYDELVTVKAASLPTVHAILDFFNQGKDTTSATCALIVHLALKMPFSPELSARLPFIFAFACMLSLVFLFVRRRYPSSFALSTGILLFAPWWMRDFGIEARGYVLMIAGTALALFCWQTAVGKAKNRIPSLIGLWFGLAFALNAHTFAILLFLPFALAELVRDYRRRHIDFPIWVAILLFPLGLVPVIHGQRLARQYYGGHFWSQPHLSMLFTPYKLLLFPPSIFLYAMLVLYLVWLAYSRRGQLAAEPVVAASNTGFSTPEWVLVVALALLPIYALPISFLIHVYRPFYVIEFAVGMQIALVALLAELGDRSRQAGFVLFAGLLVYTLGTAVSPLRRGLWAATHPRRVHVELTAAFNNAPPVNLLRGTNLPIVASEHSTYTQLNFYGTPDITGRLTALTNLPELAEQPESETGQQNLILFGPALGFRTDTAQHYFATHPHFLLTGRVDSGDWITGHLIRMQAHGQATIDFLGPRNIDPDSAMLWTSDYDVHIDTTPSHPGGE